MGRAASEHTSEPPSWWLGPARAFLTDLSERLANRIQLTTDGHGVYLEAADHVFDGQIVYAMLIKIYGPTPKGAEGKYSPSDCIGRRVKEISGNPNPKHVNTSFVERQNLRAVPESC